VAAGVGGWVYVRPNLHPQLFAAVPWIVGALMALKLGAAVAVIAALVKLGLLQPRIIRNLFVLWLAVAASVFAGMVYFLPPSWLLAAGVILSTPFTRLAAAPLALHWNRHR
jgi:hypothetical protein